MLAHLCRECGTDLAVTRATLEPHYGFMIIYCPTCGSVGVRRPHPIMRRWRALRRVDSALTVFVGNAVALAATMSATIGTVFWFTTRSMSRTPSEIWARDSAEMILTLVVFPILVGTWLTAGLGHWRRSAAWGAFTALATALFVFIAILSIVAGMRHAEVNRLWMTAPLAQLRLNLALLVFVMLVATAGIGPGLGLRRLLAVGRRAQWRWRRRRGRAERG